MFWVALRGVLSFAGLSFCVLSVLFEPLGFESLVFLAVVWFSRSFNLCVIWSHVFWEGL